MAEHYPSPSLTHTPPRPTTTTTSASLLRKLQEQVSNSTQLFGLLTLLITGAILLLLTGITVAATILGLIFFTPLIIVTSPIWVPAFAMLFLFIAGFLSMCGFGVVVVALFSSMYRYFRGLRPAGSDRVFYARNRFNDIASHVIDYGGYMQRKAMDAAPGA